jgi:hypothetical protein
MIADFVCLEEYVHNIIWRSGSESKQIYDKLTFGKRLLSVIVMQSRKQAQRVG